MKGRKSKPKVQERFSCPYCGKKAILKVEEKIVKAAVPAEKERKVIVEKDSQQTLPDVNKKR